MQSIIIGSDHAGFTLKEAIKKRFSSTFQITDKGTFSSDSVDYPDYAHAVAGEVGNGKYTFGILLCGSANGVAITANRHSGVRAAICWMPEIADLARKHNNANIICIPARFVSDETAFLMIEKFFSTEFEGGRHQKRIDKINCV
ncbi:MAG: ribose 5-phosphate isomerase B [Bacteroidia bacterium]|nr:ribose 5-phosphate isomerase B [Bacteroidia bacterium]QQR96393.1 MAG: ribose 5-phosphate isomerase B [Bacteroidota bacterium]MBP7713547.1 ribose 5-phosphate isomerase B [Bacteroidia bacterium]MBP8667389.1 ribose 5-phosphate isomerase B [Bacteroidia bacterium]HOZ82258.1 ribose 5-phosphate isomerase B [Bacteroidia bacterium]